MNKNTRVKLNDGLNMPVVALGVWQSHEDTKNAVLNALKNGYRHIDTAAAYHNEEAVGEAIKESGIPRNEIFITTKLWNEELTRQGKLFCPICNSKMVMYYRNYCPLCYGLQKYEYYDYHEMVNIIEAKYGFDVRNYHKFKNLENEYMDYWHFILDNYFDSCITNGQLVSINWKDVYDVTEKEWQKEITDCFRKEFGDRDYIILISW